MSGKSTVYALNITLPTAYNSTWRCAVAMIGSEYFNKANTLIADLCNAVGYERVNNSTIKCSSWFSKTFILSVINNKIIIQYGNVYCKNLAAGPITIKFPIAFTTSKPVVFAMPECNSTGVYPARELLYAKDATSFTYWNVPSAWLHYKWLCIGY